MRFREPAWLSIDDNSVTNNCNCKMIRAFCGAPPPEKENKKGKRTYPFTHPCSVRVSERRWKCEQELFRDVQAGSAGSTRNSELGQTTEFRGPVSLGSERATRRVQPTTTTTTTLCSKKKTRHTINKEHSEEMQGRRLPLVALRVATRRQW